MKVTATELPGVLHVEPSVHGDARGFFFESWHADRYAEAGMGCAFVQDNVSRSSKDVLRGLHLQNPSQQAKLVQVLEGDVFDVAVDVRRGAPTFGRWTSVTLRATAHNQFFIPEGFAHGFCVLSETALFAYKCSAPYVPEAEIAIAWNDPEIGIAWPVRAPNLSARDAAAPKLADVTDLLPRYETAP